MFLEFLLLKKKKKIGWRVSEYAVEKYVHKTGKIVGVVFAGSISFGSSLRFLIFI